MSASKWNMPIPSIMDDPSPEMAELLVAIERQRDAIRQSFEMPLSQYSYLYLPRFISEGFSAKDT